MVTLGKCIFYFFFFDGQGCQKTKKVTNLAAVFGVYFVVKVTGQNEKKLYQAADRIQSFTSERLNFNLTTCAEIEEFQI